MAPPSAGGARAWWDQYAALCRKNATLAARNGRTTAAQVLLGAVVCGLLLAFQAVADTLLGVVVPHPPAVQLGPPPVCHPLPHSVRVDAAGVTQRGACNTLLYAPSSPDVEALLARVAANTGLDFARDFVRVPHSSRGPPFTLALVNVTATTAEVERVLAAGGDPSAGNATCVVGECWTRPALGECLPCDAVRDDAALNWWLAAHPNSTQNALWVFGAYADAPLLGPGMVAAAHVGGAVAVGGASLGGDLSYALVYNFSSTQWPVYGRSHAPELQRALQQALLELALERRQGSGTAAAGGGAPVAPLPPQLRVHFNYSVGVRRFPVPPPRISGYDVFAANGGQWLFVVPALSFCHVLVELVYEKEAKLR